MTRPARHRTTTAFAAGAALFVAACLSLVASSSPAGAGGTGTARVLAQAKAHLLKLSDVPKGWTSKVNPNTGGGSFPGESQLASCIGVPTSTLTVNPPNVNSPELDNKDQSETVTENISAFASAKVAQREYAAVTNTKTPSCYAGILNGPIKTQLAVQFGAGSSVGNISVTKASVGGASGFSASFIVVYQGVSVPLKLTTLFAIKGIQGLQLQFTGVGPPFPSALEKHLTSVALGRFHG